MASEHRIPDMTTTTLLIVLVAVTSILPQAHPLILQRTLSPFIHTYDTLSYATEEMKQIRRRRSASAAISSQDESFSFVFHALGRHFHLKLQPDLDLFSPDARLIVGGQTWELDRSLPVRGSLMNQTGSKVYGAVVDGVFRGTINSGEEGSYHVEPSGFYFEGVNPFHSVIYHDSHVRLPPSSPQQTGGRMRRDAERQVESPHFCGWSNPQVASRMRELNPGFNRTINHQESYSSIWHDPNNEANTHAQPNLRRRRRAVPGGHNVRVCNLFLQSDTYLWERVMKLQHVDGNKELAVKEITSIFTQHVQGAQAIYQQTVFKTFHDPASFPGVSFRVDRVRINTTEEDCKPGSMYDSNSFCQPNIDVTNFLNLNSYTSHNDFCLAYAFTYRDFSGGTLGLAWVAEPGGSGGICEKHRLMQEGTQNVKKSLNTGIVTLLNYGSHVALKVSQLTFAHEMGHNFGSKHDDDHRERDACLPPINDPKGNFIMFASATSGDKENNNKFSLCSKDSIARLLDKVISSTNNCFLSTDGPFCGNQLTEDGEQCDCGYDAKDCTDQCCRPKSSRAPCTLVPSIVVSGVSRKVDCSPTAGKCCTNDCQYRGQQHLCRMAGECHNASFCSGSQARCPASPKFPDGTPCQEHTRVCKEGECLGSICERLPGWQECSLVRSEKVTAEMMCYVACKENRSDAPCISTYQLEKEPAMQKHYANLKAELLRQGKGIQLKAGAPCDNYKGYCDVFLRCRSVEAEGPLARLHGLLFSPLTLTRVSDWITVHWWAVMLMALGLIVFMGVFIKVCSVHTNSAATLHRINRRKREANDRRHKAVSSGRHRQHRSKQHKGSPVSRLGENGPPPIRSPGSRPVSIHTDAIEIVPMQGHRHPAPLRSGAGHSQRPMSVAAPPPTASYAQQHQVQGTPNYPPPPYNDIEISQPGNQHGPLAPAPGPSSSSVPGPSSRGGGKPARSNKKGAPPRKSGATDRCPVD